MPEVGLDGSPGTVGEMTKHEMSNGPDHVGTNLPFMTGRLV